MSVLGGILLDGNTLATVSATLQATDFYRQSNRIIFETMQTLDAQGTPLDLITITSALKTRGELERAGGGAYLAELVDFVPTAANIGYYCKLVKQKALARNLISAATSIAQAAYDDGAEIDDLLAEAYGRIETIGKERHGEKDHLLTLTDMAEAYEYHVKNLDKRRFITGFPALDAVIRGVAPGETMMITAYSGLFKSAWLQNLLLNGCKRNGEHHVFFSLEMPAVRVFERTCQIALEEHTYRVESGFHHHIGYKERTLDNLKEQGADKLIVCEQGGITIEKVEHYTRLARQKYGSIGAIGIDYLGLMGADNAKSEYERISHVAENSKHIAKRLNVPVIVLCQVNRTTAGAAVEKCSAKGSGAIEASADYMLGLQKDDNKDLILKLLKNRNGEEDLSYRVTIDKHYLKFRSLDPYNEVAAKNVERGKSRIRKGYLQEPEERDDDPF